MKNINLNIGKLSQVLKSGNINKNFFDFLARRQKWILFFVFLGLMGYAGFIWYRYIYSYNWTRERRDEYIKTKDTGVIFQKNKFLNLIEKEEERKRRLEQSPEEVTDIFRLNK